MRNTKCVHFRLMFENMYITHFILFQILKPRYDAHVIFIVHISFSVVSQAPR